MTTLYRSAIVPFSPAQMFDLVNDIEQYPQFLPWCPETQIISCSEHEIEATVHFAKSGWRQSFTTINRLLPFERIEMRLREGPFSHLEGIWEFQSLSNQGSQVSLNLNFEFNNKLLGMAIGPIFGQMAGTLVHAFATRAHQVYVTNSVD